MNEDLQRQLIRQLKLLNFWITTFGILILATLAVLTYMLFRMITFVQDASGSIRQFQQDAGEQLNVRDKACDQDGAVGEYLRTQTGLCR